MKKVAIDVSFSKNFSSYSVVWVIPYPVNHDVIQIWWSALLMTHKWTVLLTYSHLYQVQFLRIFASLWNTYTQIYHPFIDRYLLVPKVRWIIFVLIFLLFFFFFIFYFLFFFFFFFFCDWRKIFLLFPSFRLSVCLLKTTTYSCLKLVFCCFCYWNSMLVFISGQ